MKIFLGDAKTSKRWDLANNRLSNVYNYEGVPNQQTFERILKLEKNCNEIPRRSCCPWWLSDVPPEFPMPRGGSANYPYRGIVRMQPEAFLHSVPALWPAVEREYNNNNKKEMINYRDYKWTSTSGISNLIREKRWDVTNSSSAVVNWLMSVTFDLSAVFTWTDYGLEYHSNSFLINNHNYDFIDHGRYPLKLLTSVSLDPIGANEKLMILKYLFRKLKSIIRW